VSPAALIAPGDREREREIDRKIYNRKKETDREIVVDR